MPTRLLALVSVLLCLVLAPSLAAAVKVVNVSFQRAELDRGEDWYEVAVELDVTRDPADQLSRDPRFVEGAAVSLQLAFETRRPGDRAFEFYRSEVAFVALEEGRRIARFYLPPEVARRDRLSGAPHSFLVETRIGGAVSDARTSTSLAPEAALRSFRQNVAEKAALNDGVLVPQFETPFLLLYPESTPTALRR